MKKTAVEAAKTRASILSAARDLFCKKGIGQTTLIDIAQAAGLSRGAVYHNFRDKKALVSEIYKSLASSIYSEYEQQYRQKRTSDQRIAGFFEAWFFSLAEDEAYRAAMQLFWFSGFEAGDSSSEEISGRIYTLESWLQSECRILEQEKRLKPDTDIRQAAFQITVTFNGAAYRWFLEADKSQATAYCLTALRNSLHYYLNKPITDYPVLRLKYEGKHENS